MFIKCLPMWLFNQTMVKNKITDANVESRPNTYYISIIGTQEIVDGIKHYFNNSHPNVLNIVFDDIDRPTKYNFWVKGKGHELRDCIQFDEELGYEVLNFIQTIKDEPDTEIYIHCIMGQSRSGAIGLFINDWFEQSYSEFMFRNPQVKPNALVTSILKRIQN